MRSNKGVLIWIFIIFIAIGIGAGIYIMTQTMMEESSEMVRMANKEPNRQFINFYSFLSINNTRKDYIKKMSMVPGKVSKINNTINKVFFNLASPKITIGDSPDMTILLPMGEKTSIGFGYGACFKTEYTAETFIQTCEEWCEENVDGSCGGKHCTYERMGKKISSNGIYKAYYQKPDSTDNDKECWKSGIDQFNFEDKHECEARPWKYQKQMKWNACGEDSYIIRCSCEI